MARENLWVCDRCGLEKRGDCSYWAEVDVGGIAAGDGGGPYLVCPACWKIVKKALLPRRAK